MRGILNSVHIADIHFAAFNPADQYRILKEQFLDKIITYPSIDVISVNGDLFDHKLMANSDGVYYASLFIQNLVEIANLKQCTLLLIHGTYSHDADQLKLFYHYLEDKNVDIRIITQIQFEQIGQARILCIPELYGIDESVYDNFLHYQGFYDEAYIHGTFYGSVYNNLVGNGRLFTIHDFNMCTGFMVGGHVHHPGCFSGYFYYCGNPYRWKFGEEEDKGFLVCSHDLDNNNHYVHFEKIISPQYITVELKDLISTDPKIVIDYINNLKATQGIDYLKIKFKYPVEGTNKVIINNYYRDNDTTFIEFLDMVEEQKMKMLYNQPNSDDNNYEDSLLVKIILDNKLSDIEKFVQWVNAKEGCDFISVDELKSLLEEKL